MQNKMTRVPWTRHAAQNERDENGRQLKAKIATWSGDISSVDISAPTILRPRV